MKTRDVAADPALMARIKLDPARQLIAAQCSGTLLLAKLGLLGAVPACTDLTTAMGDRGRCRGAQSAFFAQGNVATAGAALRQAIWQRGSSRAARASKPPAQQFTTLRRWVKGRLLTGRWPT